MAMDAANFAGLSHAGAFVIVRGSSHRPARVPASRTSISRPVKVSGASARQRSRTMETARLVRRCIGSSSSMLPLSTSIYVDMLTLSTPGHSMGNMAASRSPSPRTPSRLRRPPNRYHHGDLRRALIEEAVRTIQHDGIDGLTLRAVGQRLRVSRTALYRHFADKSALLAAVARDGFRMLRTSLVEAWNQGGGGRAGFDAMGLAYVRFAVAH